VDFDPKFPPPADNPWTSGKWSEYLSRILAYVKQGQDAQFGNTPGFQVNVAGKTRWFNVPWMAYDPTAGREFVHGTTNERTAKLADLIHPAGQEEPAHCPEPARRQLPRRHDAIVQGPVPGRLRDLGRRLL
jgi:hypothetical protein